MANVLRLLKVCDRRGATLAVVLCVIVASTGFAADAPPTSGASSIIASSAPKSTEPQSPPMKVNEPTPVVKRPVWVDQADGLRGGLYQMKVLVGPEATREACERKIDDAARAAIHKYLATNYPGVPLAVYGLRDDELLPRVIGDKWEERVAGDGPANIFLHAQIRIEQRLQSQWLAAAQSYLARGRSANLIRWFLTAMWGVAVAHVALRLTPGGAVSGRRLVWAIAVVLIVLPFLA